jgi:hypothetical protein
METQVRSAQQKQQVWECASMLAEAHSWRWASLGPRRVCNFFWAMSPLGPLLSWSSPQFLCWAGSPAELCTVAFPVRSLLVSAQA